MTDFCWHFLLEPVISVIKIFNDSPEKSRKQLFGIQRHPQFASSPPFLVSFPIPSLYYPPWSRMCVSCSVVSNSLQTHGWMASSTQWRWVWENSRRWWWTGRPGVLQFMQSQRIGHDWATELNWINPTWLVIKGKDRHTGKLSMHEEEGRDGVMQLQAQGCQGWRATARS